MACQNGQTCANIGTALTLLAGLESATCIDTVPAGEGCNCDVADQQKDSVAAESYTKAGGVLTTGTGTTQRTFDYCVATNVFTYRETTAKAPIPATITMAP